MSGLVIWLTGLSGAGKSTIAERLRRELAALGRTCEVLDGDEVRAHLSSGLGFSKEDRDTNVRRIGYVAGLIARQGGVAIAAAISPYRDVRDEVRRQTPGFFEVHVRCSLEELARRDPKGLYEKALRGELPSFTGVSDPYEPPLAPEAVVDSQRETVSESVAGVLRELERRGHIRRPPVDRLPDGERLAELRAATGRAPRLEVGARDHADLYMLTTGALTPLWGFMGAADYASVIEAGRLAGGPPFTIPIVLRIEAAAAAAAKRAPRVGLWRDGEPVGLIDVQEVFPTDPAAEAERVYGTRDETHPGVRLLARSPRWAVAGEAVALRRPAAEFPRYDLTPARVRAVAAERGWRTMVGFQTRNPVHRAHEYLQKVALESVDGLLLHPLVGETKAGDVPAGVRMRCYQALLAGYFPPERTLLATNPAWMRYAGPREAVFHAIVRRNFGCSHFIVGRDHAGVGGYYETYAAQRIFERYRPGELGIEILRFENTFYCARCGGMASVRTCPHSEADRRSLSGTQVRRLLETGSELPRELTRPEVAAVLAGASAASAAG